MGHSTLSDRNAGHYPQKQQVLGFGAETGEQARSFGPAGAKIFYVDPNNVQAVDWGNPGEHPDVPLATVQAAITLCRDHAGDTIIVGANDDWQYSPGHKTAIQETVIIPHTKGGIRIVGGGPNPLACNWQVLVNTVGITVNATDVEIEGFVFDGAGTGVLLEWNGTTKYGENAVIKNCVFKDLAGGIQLEYAWYNAIDGCTFENVTKAILSLVGGSGFDFTQIKNSYFVDCGKAIEALGGCEYNEIAFNTFYNDDAQAGNAATNDGVNTTGGSHNTVHNNVFSCVMPAAHAGDWDDFNTGAVTDAWVHNQLTNGIAVTTPT